MSRPDRRINRCQGQTKARGAGGQPEQTKQNQHHRYTRQIREQKKGETTLKNYMEIPIEMLDQVTGGTVNKSPTPSNPGSIDPIINGKNYDAIAQHQQIIVQL